MTKRRTKLEAMAVKEGRGNGIEPDEIKVEGIVPPFEERLAEFQKRVGELQDELQIAFLPCIKQYNSGQLVAAIDFVDKLPTG